MKKIFIIFIILFFAKTPVFASNYITGNITNGCVVSTLHYVNNTTNFIPIFRIKTFSCQNGYFLPANTEGCQPCPSGYTCHGGTFTFDEHITQGINIPNPLHTNQNINNVCSTNFLAADNNTTNLIPVFRPKTVTLNYDNNNGTTQTGTCTYDNTINLPSAPTKPGYSFVGWVLENN